MRPDSRRQFLKTTALGLAGAGLGGALTAGSHAQGPGERPKRAEGVEVLNPRGRVPVALIVDDSTCLVNLAHFCIPQFAEVFPSQYRQPWKALPREIPDRFVRVFGEWCHEHGVKGKYSLIPHPACVGWLDRDMPGWSKRELKESVDLVRSAMMPDWDIHPEMVSHTWVIDARTGRPYPERDADHMENWGWTRGKSADQIGDYMAYALRILKNVGITCEGITTPGGFGNNALPALSLGSLQALRDVFGAEVPHYFRHLFTGDESVAPRVENASGLDGPDPRCVVSIIGCTGDWFGGWDGLTPGSADRFLTEDGKSGRLAEVIRRGEPTILVGHWPGFYFNGDEVGFSIFQKVVDRLESHFDHLAWMKLSSIARYWAARELTRIETRADSISLHAPFACPSFTLRIADRPEGVPTFVAGDGRITLREVKDTLKLESSTWTRKGRDLIACVDLPRGESQFVLKTS
ncbi:MAG TPA: twin-arginine translocation signal domain-containing protein [Isosphaeraceae bacterium]|jgi:hypothetical protein|nr:twin-arginine translocation signal domain-containing protein [Isosphaeraceae bacterium]